MAAAFGKSVTYHAVVHAMKRAGFEGGLSQFMQGACDPPRLTHKVEHRPPPGAEWEDPLAEGEVKTLVISDLHIPMQDDELVKIAMRRDGDADQLVVNGDLLDVDQVMIHGSERDGVLRQEYNHALSRLVEWSLMFKRVYVTWGNHDLRPERYKRKRIPIPMHFLFSTLIDNLVNGMQYGEASGKTTGQVDLPNVYGHGESGGWWVRVGDCVIAHPQSFYKRPGETARRTLRNFLFRHEGVRAAIIGHTHMLWRERVALRAPYLPPKSLHLPEDWMVIESGCLCKILNYTIEGKLNYERPRQPGYAVLYQVDGVTDMERTDYVDLGEEGRR
jgi:predicted phosphodiesterase